jgi:hypothetical protein
MFLCNVCCYNKSETNMVHCKSCNYKSCKNCNKKYLLTLSKKEPDCLNCNNIYNKYDLIFLFGIKWVLGKFMKHKNSFLYKKQIHLLELTKGDADKNKKEDLIIEKKKKLLLEKRRINKELKDLKAELIQLNEGDDIVPRRSSGGDIVSSEGEVCSNKVSKDFIVSCSYCEGVLDESYKCMICYKFTCIHCNCLYEGVHNCNYKMTQCPGCKEFYSKENGCDNVKCIKCNTFFNWNSGKIINNETKISFYSYFPSKIFIAFDKLDFSSIKDDDKITLYGIYTHIIEFIRFKSLKLIDVLNMNNNKYKINRINYLNGKINKTKFYRTIIKQSKSENYKLFIINIILSAYQKAINVFNNGNNYLIELNKIINETNEMIISITKYLKYNNNIKILHWFNLNDIEKLIKI